MKLVLKPITGKATHRTLAVTVGSNTVAAVHDHVFVSPTGNLNSVQIISQYNRGNRGPGPADDDFVRDQGIPLGILNSALDLIIGEIPDKKKCKVKFKKDK